MNESDVLGRIGDLVAEELMLRDRAGDGQGLDDSERGRLRELEEQLDQCWDLLRQRRAKEEFGEDPGEAAVRPVREVESYQQ